MTSTIFCPSDHLVLDAPSCQVCGWKRPAPVGLGQPVWGPFELGAGLGGPGRGVYASPAAAQGVVVFPLRNGELVGLNLSDGGVRWRIALQAGLMARSLAADGDRLLLSLSDERPLDQAGAGHLTALDPLSGNLTQLWEPRASLLSSPVLTDERIILRTSAPELVALQRKPIPEIAWRRQLQAWFPLLPVVVEMPSQRMLLLADGSPMQGAGMLLAISLLEGEPLWQQPTDGFLAYPPAQAGEVLLYRNGLRKLTAAALESGQLLWERSYSRIYSGLQASTDRAYMVVRGEVPAGEKGYYLLQALDPLNNTLAWEAPLPARMRVLHLLGDNLLLLGSDEGTLLGYETSTGENLWTYQLGSDEDPIQSEFCLLNGWVLAGTYAGKVVALQITAASGPSANPEATYAQGDYHEAAALYALQGDLPRAAEIFASQLGEIEKALALYAHAGQFATAGELARTHQLYPQALEYFGLADDALAQAQLLLEMGDELEAARKFEQAGELRQAAGLYESAGELRRALTLYQKLADIPAVLRLFFRVNLTPDDVDWLLRQGRLVEAGQAAQKIGALERAAKIFAEANESQMELGALLELTQNKPEPWSLGRLAELARKQGQFQQEAMAWERLGKPIKAAEAYYRAARQGEQLHPDDEGAIASLFERAHNLYEEAGLREQCQECWAKVVHYRRLPRVIVEGRTERAFREGEFNTLLLTVHNIGRGIAHEVNVQIGSQRFEVDISASGKFLRRLAPQHQQATIIYLKPMKEQIGDEVPLALEWSWKDAEGKPYHDRSSTPVKVKRMSEPPTGGTPTVIHYHGTVYTTEDGHIEIISGDKIGGDRIEGDKVEHGAQKGDRVEIHRGEGGRSLDLHLDEAVTGEQEAASRCPNCHLPLKEAGAHCQECGFDLSKEE